MNQNKKYGKITGTWPLVLFVSGIFLAGCAKNEDDLTPQISGEGPVITMPLELDSFNKVHLLSMGNINIVVSDTFSVVMEAQQNILDLMDWIVEDETLYWGNKEAVDIIEAEKILCSINLPHEIESVIHAGIGSVQLVGDKQENLYLEMNGFGYIEAFDLEANNVEANISGFGDVGVRVVEELSGLISGQGNIYYKGNPVLNVHVIGSGTVIDDNN